MNKIAITTGDKKGIGRELVEKALDELNLDREEIVIIGENIAGLEDYETVEVKIENNGEFCFRCLEVACKMAHDGEIKGIVTAPVSKEELHKAGHKYNGQTEVLEHFLGDNKHKAEMLLLQRI